MTATRTDYAWPAWRIHAELCLTDLGQEPWDSLELPDAAYRMHAAPLLATADVLVSGRDIHSAEDLPAAAIHGAQLVRAGIVTHEEWELAVHNTLGSIRRYLRSAGIAPEQL